MKTIWKFGIHKDGKTDTIFPNRVEIGMPKDAEIISVMEQDNDICLHAIVDSEAPKDRRFFEVFGTGHEIKGIEFTERKYIGSAKVEDGKFIFHIFEII